MPKFNCAAYGGNASDVRFYLTSTDDASAIAEAKAEAQRLDHTAVFVEDASGRFVFDDAVEAPAPKY